MIWRGARRPGELRIGGFDADGRLLEIHLLRADAGPQPGAVLAGRVRRTGGVATLDWGGAPVVLERAEASPEGMLAAAEVVRAAIAEPGRLRPARARLIDYGLDVPGLIVPAPAPEERFPGLIWVPSLDDLDEALDVVDRGEVQCGDFALSLERTRGGLVIDVDGGGDPCRANLAAAAEIARLLRLYQVGGSVLVDFRAMAGRADRQAVTDAVLAAQRDDPRPCEHTAVNGYGLMQLVRPRPRPSVLDVRYGVARHGVDAATLALDLLAQALASRGVGTRTVVAPPPVARWLEAQQALRAEVTQRLGAALVVVADPAMSGTGHVHVEHP